MIHDTSLGLSSSAGKELHLLENAAYTSTSPQSNNSKAIEGLPCTADPAKTAAFHPTDLLYSDTATTNKMTEPSCTRESSPAPSLRNLSLPSLSSDDEESCRLSIVSSHPETPMTDLSSVSDDGKDKPRHNIPAEKQSPNEPQHNLPAEKQSLKKKTEISSSKQKTFACPKKYQKAVPPKGDSSANPTHVKKHRTNNSKTSKNSLESKMNIIYAKVLEKAVDNVEQSLTKKVLWYLIYIYIRFQISMLRLNHRLARLRNYI